MVGVLLAILLSVFLVATGNNHSHHAIKTSCNYSLNPNSCFFTLSNLAPHHLSHGQDIETTKDVILLALNITTDAVEAVKEEIQKSFNHKITKRERAALEECRMNMDDTLDEVAEIKLQLQRYPYNLMKKQYDDLNTLASSALTDQESCLHVLEAHKLVHDDKELINNLQLVKTLCSNFLSMIKGMTDSDIADEIRSSGRKLVEDEWPEWVFSSDRKLLQSPMIIPDVVVAADGSGNYKTISAAVAAAPSKSVKRYVIKIQAGIYVEHLVVLNENIMFLGDGRTTTVITGSRNNDDDGSTTSSATVTVVGKNFLAKDVRFENTAGPSKHQAVALLVSSDQSAFYQCDIIAYQDTLYVYKNRQFFTNCFISGTVDFIFGNSAVVFQDCDIEARRPNIGQKNMLTAQGRTDPHQNTGIIIHKCRIGATSDLKPVQENFPTFLGRPWQNFSRTLVMESTISDVIDPAGWSVWNGTFALNTLFYGEFQNSGPGASTLGRVKWEGYKVITLAEAQQFAPGNFLDGLTWLPSTGFPFTIGL